MKQRHTLPWLIMALCAIPALALAQPYPWGKPGGAAGPQRAGLRMGPGPHFQGQGLPMNWWSKPKVQEVLGLTEEQISALSEQSSQIRKEQIDIRAGLEKAQIELEEALQADPVDEEKAIQAAKQLGDLTGQQVELNASHRLAVAKTLTAEQRKKAKGLLAEFARQRWEKADQPSRDKAGMMKREAGAGDRLRERKRIHAPGECLTDTPVEPEE